MRSERSCNIAGRAVDPRVVAAKRVLVVDDEPRDAEILARLLKAEGFEIFIASGGEKALRLMMRNSYDIVIMDVKMPGMNGHEVAVRAREISNHAETPILFISGASGRQEVIEAFRAGGCDFVAKPFAGDELVARVRAHLTAGAAAKKAYRQRMGTERD